MKIQLRRESCLRYKKPKQLIRSDVQAAVESNRRIAWICLNFRPTVGGWGPASLEEGDVGMEHFYYPAMFGIIEMVMGNARAFEYAPEYGDIRGDTFLLDCP